MERKRKFGAPLLGIFLMFTGWFLLFEHGSLFSDSLDVWHWQLPDKFNNIYYCLAILALPVGASMLIGSIVFFFKPQIRRVELLAIILACVLLAGTLTPVIISVLEGRGREGGKHNCFSNQRQLATAFQMYVQDNHDRWPSAWKPIYQYGPSQSLYICPNTKRRFHTLGGYGVNAFILGKQLENLDDPTTQLLTMDAKEITSLIHSPEDIAWRHQDKNGLFFIASFIDGHAARVDDMGKVRLRLNEQPDKK